METLKDLKSVFGIDLNELKVKSRQNNIKYFMLLFADLLLVLILTYVSNTKNANVQACLFIIVFITLVFGILLSSSKLHNANKIYKFFTKNKDSIIETIEIKKENLPQLIKSVVKFSPNTNDYSELLNNLCLLNVRYMYDLGELLPRFPDNLDEDLPSEDLVSIKYVTVKRHKYYVGLETDNTETIEENKIEKETTNNE